MFAAAYNFLHDLDIAIFLSLIQLSTDSVWVAGFAVLIAEWLVIVYPLVLLYLWRRPHTTPPEFASRKAVVMAAIAAVSVMAIKTITAAFLARDRPFIHFPDLITMPNSPLDPQSFPSGHTMLAFTIAYSLYLSGFRKLGGVLLILAVFVGLGRVLIGVHFPSDVVVGALIGLAVAYYFHREASTLKAYLPNE